MGQFENPQPRFSIPKLTHYRTLDRRL